MRNLYVVEIDQVNNGLTTGEVFACDIDVCSIAEVCEQFDMMDDDVEVSYTLLAYDDGSNGDSEHVYDEEEGFDLLEIYKVDDTCFTCLESGSIYYTIDELEF